MPPIDSGNNLHLNTFRAGLHVDRVSGTSTITTNSDQLLATSTNIVVKANGTPVGLIQSFSIQEQRNITKLQEVGSEGVIQAVPGNTNGGTINVSRIALYGINLMRALGGTISGNAGMNFTGQGSNIFYTLRNQRVPFEIQVQTKLQGVSIPYTDGAAGGSLATDPAQVNDQTFRGGQGTDSPTYTTQWYTETYIDCWLQSFNKTVGVGQITISETATISYADVIAE